MYTLTGLGQPQTRGDCSGWEKDPESFSKRVADHYVRTVLKMGITVKRIYPHYSTGKDIMDVDFTDELTVAVSFRGSRTGSWRCASATSRSGRPAGTATPARRRETWSSPRSRNRASSRGHLRSIAAAREHHTPPCTFTSAEVPSGSPSGSARRWHLAPRWDRWPSGFR